MTQTSSSARPAMNVRIIHGSLVAGCLLFAAILALVIVPQRAGQGVQPMSGTVINVLLGVSLVATVTSFVLRGRVPRRNTSDSADLFWTTAGQPAMLSWTAAEAGGLLGLVAYMLSGSSTSLIVAGLAVATLASLYPGRLERV